MLVHSSRRQAALRPHRTRRTTCTQRELCARCALVKVITYRFAVFERSFGRLPLPDEALFFVRDSSPHPIPAPRKEFLRQLSEAAQRLDLRLPMLLRMLGIKASRSKPRLRAKLAGSRSRLRAEC